MSRNNVMEEGKKVEAYETATEIIVCGIPPADEHLPEEDRHNCDADGWALDAVGSNAVKIKGGGRYE